MGKQQMPWSFHAIVISFGIFFASISIYVTTRMISHPLSSDLWLIGVVLGFVLLLYSIRMVRIHQKDLIENKQVE